MPKPEPAKKPKPKVHKPKKITIGELVLQQVEEREGKKWEDISKELDSLPYIKTLKDTLERTRKFGEILNSNPYLGDTFRRMAEAQRQWAEPLQRLAEPMRQINEQVERLNKMGAFRLPPALIATLENLPKLSIPAVIDQGHNELELIEPQLTYSPPPIIALRNQVSILEEKLEDMGERFKQTMVEQFDKFAKEFKIPVGFKNAECRCKFCGNVLVKFEGIFFFTEGTMKCGSCSKMLQLPRDMKITAT